MNTSMTSEMYDYWKKRAFIGPLPQGFLKVGHRSVQQEQEAADQQAALALQQLQMRSALMTRDQRVDKLTITVVQAKLVKNYGMTKMDPYVRLRVGHKLYETHTDSNGGKNPHWNKIIHCSRPRGSTQIYIEIYDECSFVMDELIAWGHVTIPPKVLKEGETHEDWYTLSGKQGDNLEGMINLVFSYTGESYPYVAGSPVVMVPSGTMFGMTSLPNAEVELKQLAEMFPNIDKEVIKSVYDVNHGKNDITIRSLIQMCE